MKGVVQFISLLFFSAVVCAQTISTKLSDAVQRLERDEQMKYGLLAYYVADNTGTVVFQKNGHVGLPVASTQKVITATTALELLGSDYTFKTVLGYNGNVNNGVLKGHLYVIGSGDPTLGSWRFDNTKEGAILNRLASAVKKEGIKSVTGSLYVYDGQFETQTVPGGWIWDDIGNYYGAGVSGLNWRENQYEVKLKSGRPGDAAGITNIEPPLYNIQLISEATAGKAGSGDNGYIYLGPYSKKGFIRGTIPPGEGSFTLKGSFPDPGFQFATTLLSALKKQGIDIDTAASFNTSQNQKLPESYNVMVTHTSPALSEMLPAFLKKSINLYGEALLKTLGYEKKDEGSTEAGLSVVKAFWKSSGIDINSMNITDGSGLSLQSRVTAEALVKVMLFAKKRPWFNIFNSSLPEFNGIKMKSGTISGIKSFTGYINGYTFAIIVNNYSGSSSEMTGKLYRILDVLK